MSLKDLSRAQDVGFYHDETYLHGTLYTPKNASTYPLVILIPGTSMRTSPIDYNGTFDHLVGIIGTHLLKENIAIFQYARAGTGKSKGDWRTQNLYDRADEIISAIDAIQKLDDCPYTHLILLGHSNGGWVAPLVANLSSQVDAIITVAGPSISFGEQALSAFKIFLESADISITEHIQLMSYVQSILKLYDLMIAGKRTEFKTFKHKLLSKPLPKPDLIKKFDYPMPQWEERQDILASMDGLINYDAMPPLRNLQCPTLVIFGADDTAFDSVENASRFETALFEAENPHYSIHIIPDANHRLQVRNDEGELETSEAFRVLVSTWINHQLA